MSGRDDATEDGAGEAGGADFSAILRDDAFVEQVRARGGDGSAAEGPGAGSVDDSVDGELARLFGAAHDEVHGVPLPEPPSEDQLAAALAEGLAEAGTGPAPVGGPRPRRRRWLTSVSAGAASVAVLLGGIAIAGHYYGADSTTRQSTQEVVTAASVRTDLNYARSLLDRHDTAGCIAVIRTATQRMTKIRNDPAFEELNGLRVRIWSRATGRPASEAPKVGEPPRTTTDAPTSTEQSTEAPPSEGAEHGGGGSSGGGSQVVVQPAPPTSTVTQPPTTTTPPPETSTTDPSDTPSSEPSSDDESSPSESSSPEPGEDSSGGDSSGDGHDSGGDGGYESEPRPPSTTTDPAKAASVTAD